MQIISRIIVVSVYNCDDIIASHLLFNLLDYLDSTDLL